jgi:hypothetical protein
VEVDEVGAALGVVVKPNAVFGASVGLLAAPALSLLEPPPPNTLCVWVVEAPNGEAPALALVLFENGDCAFAVPPNGEGAVLLPNGDAVVELPNGEDAVVVENADLTGSLFWFEVLPNGDCVVALLPKGDAVVVVGKDDLAGSLFWFEVFGNPLKLNLGTGGLLVAVDSAGVVVVLRLFAFMADAGVVGCLKLNARGVLWDGAFCSEPKAPVSVDVAVENAEVGAFVPLTAEPDAGAVFLFENPEKLNLGVEDEGAAVVEVDCGAANGLEVLLEVV